MLLDGYRLNRTVIPMPGLKLLTPVCKNFAGQALLTDLIIYVLHSCLILYVHQRYTLSFKSYCSFKTITYLRSHSLSLQTVNSSINAYRYSYFIKIPFYETLSQLVWITVYCQAIPPICMFFFHLANFYILLILFVVI